MNMWYSQKYNLIRSPPSPDHPHKKKLGVLLASVYVNYSNVKK